MAKRKRQNEDFADENYISSRQKQQQTSQQQQQTSQQQQQNQQHQQQFNYAQHNNINNQPYDVFFNAQNSNLIVGSEYQNTQSQPSLSILHAVNNNNESNSRIDITPITTNQHLKQKGFNPIYYDD